MAEGSTLKSNPNPVVIQPAALLRAEGNVSDTLVSEIFGELEVITQRAVLHCTVYHGLILHKTASAVQLQLCYSFPCRCDLLFVFYKVQGSEL